MELNKGYQTEELDWVTSKFHGLIIGKGGRTINEIKSQSGADVIIDRNGSGKCLLKGDEHQREAAREMIREKINKKNDDPSEDWFELDFVGEDMIGAIIGKNGDKIKQLQNKWKISLKYFYSKKKLFIKGNPKTNPEIEKACDALHQFLWTMKIGYASQAKQKFLCITGNSERITTVQNPLIAKLTFLKNPPIIDDETTSQQITNILLQAFQITKEKENEIVDLCNGELPKSCVDYVVHAGRMAAKRPAGTFSSQSKSFQQSLIYQRLTPDDLDIVKMESLPKIKEYSRYDLTIVTPRPFHRIRYKIFLARKENGEICFITNQEAGVNENEFKNIREGPGYFSTTDLRTASIDLVDPEHGITTRINTCIYFNKQIDEENLKHHLESLAPFLNGIIIHPNGEDDHYKGSEIMIPPKLPPGFELNYYRRVTRAAYRFAEKNILRTSKEKVFVHEDSYFHDNQSDVVDLFFENKEINDVLRGNDWQPTQVAEVMKKLLRFSKTMLEYCLN